MKNKINRREFIANTVTVGLGACLVTGAVSNLASANEKAWKYPATKEAPRKDAHISINRFCVAAIDFARNNAVVTS